jgi:outer membrane receptor protein involved in Fe transport
LSYNFNEAFDVVVGLRYLRRPDNYTLNSTNIQTGITTDISTNVEDRNQLTGRVALIYELSKHQNFKFLIGTAKKDSVKINLEKPEDIITYEINHLLTYDSFQLSTSVFYNEINNIVQRKLEINPNTGNILDETNNDGEWRTYGLEFIGNYFISQDWHLQASATVQDTKDKFYDTDVGYSPKLLAKLQTDYSHKNFIYALNVNYVSHMQTGYSFEDTDLNPATPKARVLLGDDVDAYVLVGANVRYTDPTGIYLNLNVSNLFDTEYRYATNEVSTMKQGLIGMGRVITGTLGYKF